VFPLFIFQTNKDQIKELATKKYHVDKRLIFKLRQMDGRKRQNEQRHQVFGSYVNKDKNNKSN